VTNWVGHNTYKPGTKTWRELITTFGTDIVNTTNNTIDRKKLAHLVFGNERNILLLNSIVWPAIENYLKKKLLCLEAQGSRIAVIEAALLIESGVDKLTDEVWVLGVPEEEAIKRVVTRGLSEHEARLRIAAQLPLEERKKDVTFLSIHIQLVGKKIS